MAKVHKTYRLDADLVAQVEAWAQAHGTNQGEAMAQLLSRGLDRCSTANELRANSESDTPRSPSEARESSARTTSEPRESDARSESEVREQSDLVAVLRGNVADLRGQVTTLTAQLAAKDEQISGLMEQASSLMAIVGNAQALQGVAEQRALMAESRDQEDALDVSDLEAEPQEAAGGHESDGIDQEGQKPADVAQEAAHERGTGFLAAIARWFGGE